MASTAWRLVSRTVAMRAIFLAMMSAQTMSGGCAASKSAAVTNGPGDDGATPGSYGAAANGGAAWSASGPDAAAGDASTAGDAASNAVTPSVGPCAPGGKLTPMELLPLDGLGMALTWSPDSKDLAVGGHFLSPTIRYDTRVYSVASGALSKTFECHVYWVNAVAWGTTVLGEVIADGSFGHAVGLWNPLGSGGTDCSPGTMRASEGNIAKLPDLDGATTALAFSPDGRYLADANRDPSVRIWQLGPGPNQFKVVALWAESSSTIGNFLSVAWSPNGRRLATGDFQAGRVAVWAFDPLSTDANIGLWDQATIDAFAGVAFANQAQWYKANAQRVTRTPMWGDGGHQPVWNVRFSPDATFVAGAAEDGKVSVFDAETGAARFSLHASAGAKFMGMDWSPDGSRIAAGASDKSVYIFDTQARGLSDTLTGHADGVTAVAWSHDGCMLASTAGGRLVNSPDNHAISCSPTDTYAGCSDQHVHLWRFP